LIWTVERRRISREEPTPARASVRGEAWLGDPDSIDRVTDSSDADTSIADPDADEDAADDNDNDNDGGDDE
jgi:hypothetical protein